MHGKLRFAIFIYPMHTLIICCNFYYVSFSLEYIITLYYFT